MTIESNENSVQLRIVDADLNDVNKGIARINPVLLKSIAFKENDPVLLINSRTKAKTAAFLQSCFSEEMAPDEIKICPALRRNLKAKLNDVISVRKSTVMPAKRITFTNLNAVIPLQNSQALASKLAGRVIAICDVLSFSSPKGRIDLQVTKYSPHDVETVLIRKDTKIECLSVVNAT